MTITNEKIQRMVAAAVEGAIAGEALKVGDIFRGAWPAAEAAGFTERAERSCFIDAYLARLQPHGHVMTDGAGRIVRFGR